ncbi:MAG: ATP-binding cassette domain-containing protein, partial [Phycisphaerae bacterium]
MKNAPEPVHSDKAPTLAVHLDGDGSPARPVSDGVIHIKNLTVRYGNFEAVKNVSLSISSGRVTAIIGPSGCGKSTLLRTLNRMNDFVPGVQV